MEFRDRQKIDRYLGRGNDPFDVTPRPSDQHSGQARANPYAFIHERAYGSLDGSGYDPDEEVCLDSMADRFRALNELHSQQGAELGKDGYNAEHTCGAYVLLSGAIMGDGNIGIATLIDSVEAFQQENVKSEDAARTKKETAALNEIKEKIGKGENLTAHELNLVANKVYGLLNADGNAGTRQGQVEALMKSSPKLRELFAKKDLTYDSAGGHAVLGIGHGKGDKDHTGEHQAVYDPYRRATIDPMADTQEQEARAQLTALMAAKAKHAHGWTADRNLGEVAMEEMEIGKAKAALATAQMKAKAARQDLGQVVTDQDAMYAYTRETGHRMDFADDNGQAASLYGGMY